MSDGSLQSDVRDVIIIGSGPAGLTAAIYAARANLAPLVLEGEPSSTSDHRAASSCSPPRSRTTPGSPDGIMGPELMERLPRAGRALRRRAGHRRRSTAVDFDAARSEVHVRRTRAPGPHRDRRHRRAARDARPRRRGSGCIGHGVSTCATCDGFFFRGQRDRRRRRRRLGDGRGDLPHQVRRQGHRRPPPRRAARVEDHAGPRVRQPQDRVRVEHGRRRRGRRARRSRASTSYATSTTGESATLPVTGLFVAIGHRPEHRSVRRPARHATRTATSSTQPGSTATNVDGVFACGDVQDHVPPGGHRRRLRLHGGDRRRALARAARATRTPGCDRAGAEASGR